VETVWVVIFFSVSLLWWRSSFDQAIAIDHGNRSPSARRLKWRSRATINSAALQMLRCRLQRGYPRIHVIDDKFYERDRRRVINVNQGTHQLGATPSDSDGLILKFKAHGGQPHSFLRFWRVRIGYSEHRCSLGGQIPIVRCLLQKFCLEIRVRFVSGQLLKLHGAIKVLGKHLHEMRSGDRTGGSAGSLSHRRLKQSRGR
jgi:hypothetical protein